MQTSINPLITIPAPNFDGIKGRLTVRMKAEEFSLCIETLAQEARRELEATRNAADPRSVEALNKQKWLNRFAVDLNYIYETRLSFLPTRAILNFNIEEVGIQDFQNFRNGQPYALENLALAQDWFKSARAATDRHITPWRIDKAVRHFHQSRMCDVLATQPNDTEKETSAISVLNHSAFGRQLLQTAADAGYVCRFSDIKVFNNIKNDLRARTAVAVCHTGADGITKNIYVDTDSECSSIYHAIKLGHECGHIAQNYLHFGIQKHKTKKSRAGVIQNANQYAAMKEAHSIATEYIVASELMMAGFDVESIYYSLYQLHPSIVNKLATDPVGFLKTVSMGEMVRKKWGFKSSRRKYSPGIARKLATSLIPLNTPWVNFEEASKVQEPEITRQATREIGVGLTRLVSAPC